MKNSKELYSVHPSVAYAKRIIENLEGKTGRSLNEWRQLIQCEGPTGSKERRAWLKSQYGLGGTTAVLTVSAAEGSSPEDYDDDAYLEMAVVYVNELYGGKKAHLRPIQMALMCLAFDLGDDIRASPCKTMVPIYRNHVIAQIKPTTLTRVDFGFALKGCAVPYADRLVDTGGLEKGDRITHRMSISNVSEIDDEVSYWLGVAYDLNE